MKSLFLEVPTAEVLLQPAIEGDEQIAAAHLPDLEFRFAGASVAPGDWHYRPGISAHDGLQRQFHREVEVRREERAAAFDDGSPVCLEGVGEVIQRRSEERRVGKECRFRGWPYD